MRQYTNCLCASQEFCILPTNALDVAGGPIENDFGDDRMSLGRPWFAVCVGVVVFLLPGHPGTYAGDGGDDILDVVRGSGRFTAFLAALHDSGLDVTLKAQGPFTMFAPTDEAFAKVPRTKLDPLLKDRSLLRKFLLFHVVSGRYSSPEFLNKRMVRTMNGRGLRAAMRGNAVTVENALIVTADLPAANGVVHVIDAVLIPPTAGEAR